MGRLTNPLTGTQLDEKAFGLLTKRIKEIGRGKLSAYGLVSHETIYQYAKRRPVGPKTEEKIIQSIALYEKDLREQQETSKKEVKTFLERNNLILN